MNPKKGYGENETGVFKREVLNGNLQREKLKGGRVKVRFVAVARLETVDSVCR